MEAGESTTSARAAGSRLRVAIFSGGVGLILLCVETWHRVATSDFSAYSMRLLVVNNIVYTVPLIRIKVILLGVNVLNPVRCKRA